MTEDGYRRGVTIVRTAPGPNTGDTLLLIEETSGRRGWWITPGGGLGSRGTGDRHATLRR